ncbi:MAG: hypothetical protein HZC42_10240 [Candidatus Eisenbacteria bacterium]|nr:hypothetical protein [Candidatus Eisenbacteria bacterium]
MKMRAMVIVLVMGVAALAFYAWSRNTARQPAPPQAGGGETGGSGVVSGADAPAMPPGMPGGSEVVIQSGGDPGVAWVVPKRWVSEPGSAMRLATYGVPRAAGDSEDARCAVYYFGPGQGGGTDANLQRWTDEFADAGAPERTTRSSGGLEISRLRLRGTYLAHAGMGGDGQGTKPDHELLGAIVTGANGSVFFKLAGPARTVDAAAREFDAMLASLKKK